MEEIRPEDYSLEATSLPPDIWGNSTDGYFSHLAVGATISWGNDPFGKATKAEVLEIPENTDPFVE